MIRLGQFNTQGFDETLLLQIRKAIKKRRHTHLLKLLSCTLAFGTLFSVGKIKIVNFQPKINFHHPNQIELKFQSEIHFHHPNQIEL